MLLDDVVVVVVVVDDALVDRDNQKQKTFMIIKLCIVLFFNTEKENVRECRAKRNKKKRYFFVFVFVILMS